MNIYDISGCPNGDNVRATFREMSGPLLMAAIFIILIILLTVNVRATRIYPGLVSWVSSIRGQLAPSNYPVWVMPSLVRVGMTDAPGTTSSISLSGARGETVDTQVVVQAPSVGLSNVNLNASALTGPGGATIPASNVTLYREYYISVTGTASYGGGSNPPL